MTGWTSFASWQKVLRRALLTILPGMALFATMPSVSAEPATVQPESASTPLIFGKYQSLSLLDNPVRAAVLKRMAQDPGEGWKAYNDVVEAGREVYYLNCFFCHGDLLDGKGPFAHGANWQPGVFLNIDSPAQLQEPRLFWRASENAGKPATTQAWQGVAPVWHEMLDETQVWQAITFLYDYAGQVPAMKGADAPPARLTGTALFAHRCQVCHGKQGAGDGPAAGRMYPKPRDFTLALFKYKTTPGTELPTDDDLFNTIKQGLPGSGMPTWGRLLNDEQIRSLIPVIKSFDTTAAWAPDDADDEAFDDDGRYLKTDYRVVRQHEPLLEQVPFSAASVAKGKQTFEKICAKCHGAEGRGNITSGKKLKDDWGNRIWPRDLTKPWTWRATNRLNSAMPDNTEKTRDTIIKNIYTRLSIGIPGTPMPAHRATEAGNKDPISQENRWHVANYVYSLRNTSVAPTGETLLTAIKANGMVPESPTDEVWESVPATTLPLVPNIIKNDPLFTPLNDAITVRVLYDATDISFLLTLNDRTDSRPGEKVSTQIQDRRLPLRSDAMAIRFPKQDFLQHRPPLTQSLFRHGGGSHKTTMWYWNAGSASPAIAPEGVLLDADAPKHDVMQRRGNVPFTVASEWQNGQWRVLMKRPRQNGDSGDINFNEGAFIPVSFADWDGSDGENGARHTQTSWYWLTLSPQTAKAPPRSMVWLLAVVAGVALLGLLLLRRLRKTKT